MDSVHGVKTVEKLEDWSRMMIAKINWKMVPIKVVYFSYALGMFSFIHVKLA